MVPLLFIILLTFLILLTSSHLFSLPQGPYRAIQGYGLATRKNGMSPTLTWEMSVEDRILWCYGQCRQPHSSRSPAREHEVTSIARNAPRDREIGSQNPKSHDEA